MRRFQSTHELPEITTRFLAVTAAVTAVGLFLLSAVARNTEAQVVTEVHSFNSSGFSGNPLYVAMTQGRDGKLYGTTEGTTLDFGSVFRLQTTGAASDVYVLDGTQGEIPDAGVTLGTDGSLYGTIFEGGSGGFGVLFKVTPSGSYTVLHDFAGGADGGFPLAAPIQASDGNLYGTTEGSTTSTVYKYSPSSGLFSTIYQFDQAHGVGAIAQVIQGTDGNLYGTAY